MLQASFKGEPCFSPSVFATTILVFGIHNYYFASRGVSSDNERTFVYQDAKNSARDGEFRTFVGEWSIQAAIVNNLAFRGRNADTGLYPFSPFTQYTAGSACWTAKFTRNATVDGEGTQADYWNYNTFILNCPINAASGATYCT